MPWADIDLARAYQREYGRKRYAAGKAWQQQPENQEHQRQKRRRRCLKQYDLTPEQWDLIFAAQGKRCAICREDQSSIWHTDHCHTTNMFRGILCKKCNNGIGQLQDSPDVLRAAATYIEAARLKHEKESQNG